MTGLADIVGCDLISYNEIDLVGGATQTIFEPVFISHQQLQEAFAALIHEHPLVRSYAATRDPRPLRMSDFISLSELQSLNIYDAVFRPLETNHQLAFSMSIDTDIVVGIGLNRWRGDFDRRDIARMDHLRPHLVHAFHHAQLKDERVAAHRRNDQREERLPS